MSSAAERKEQYKQVRVNPLLAGNLNFEAFLAGIMNLFLQVRAHVKKDDGRMQAYGWSLPAKQPSPDSAAASTMSGGKSPSEETQVREVNS